MPHEPITCRWCGLRIPDKGECREAVETYVFALVYAKELPESERQETVSLVKWQAERHLVRLCHCPDRPWTLFSSTPQPQDLGWHDKHDR
jgi:hypothetical protein